MSEMIYSGFYGKEFSRAFVEEAIEYYERWCKANGQSSELDPDQDIDDLKNNEALLNHVLYHAEIEGMDMEE